MLTLITLIIVLSLLVFVHEAGHFIVAKKAGIQVDEFGFGFPPRAWGFRRRKGGTLYSLNWIPLGGFVKIKGELGEHAGDKDAFGHKPYWVRALVLAAGVFMNLVLCWFLMTVGYMIGFPQVAEDLSPNARVREAKVQVEYVLPGSPAEKAGMTAGDTVIALEGAAVTDADQVRNTTAASQDKPVALTVLHEGAQKTLSVTPVFIKESGKAAIGVQLVRTGLVSYPWYIAPIEGAHATWVLGGDILTSFRDLFRDLVVKRQVTQELSGPVGIVFITADVAAQGFRHLLQFTAILSLNLAILNILPIPALDGGRLAFLIVEAIRRKPNGRKVEQYAHGIGFFVLMLLVVVITFHDFVHFGGRIRAGFLSVFGR